MVIGRAEGRRESGGKRGGKQYCLKPGANRTYRPRVEGRKTRKLKAYGSPSGNIPAGCKVHCIKGSPQAGSVYGGGLLERSIYI